MALRRYQGSLKTQGGKLVNVDFAIVDDKLKDVVLHGDFFLHPEDALQSITAALEGLSTKSSQDEIAQLVTAAIPANTEWLGTSPAAVARAVERGIAQSKEDPSGGGERGFG